MDIRDIWADGWMCGACWPRSCGAVPPPPSTRSPARSTERIRVGWLSSPQRRARGSCAAAGKDDGPLAGKGAPLPAEVPGKGAAAGKDDGPLAGKGAPFPWPSGKGAAAGKDDDLVYAGLQRGGGA